MLDKKDFANSLSEMLKNVDTPNEIYDIMDIFNTELSNVQDYLAKRPVKGYAFTVPVTIYVDYIVNACSQEEAKEKVIEKFDITTTDVVVNGNYADDIECDPRDAHLVPYSNTPQRKYLGYEVFCDEEDNYYYLDGNNKKYIIHESYFDDEEDFGY